MPGIAGESLKVSKAIFKVTHTKNTKTAKISFYGDQDLVDVEAPWNYSRLETILQTLVKLNPLEGRKTCPHAYSAV